MSWDVMMLRWLNCNVMYTYIMYRISAHPLNISTLISSSSYSLRIQHIYIYIYIYIYIERERERERETSTYGLWLCCVLLWLSTCHCVILEDYDCSSEAILKNVSKYITLKRICHQSKLMHNRIAHIFVGLYYTCTQHIMSTPMFSRGDKNPLSYKWPQFRACNRAWDPKIDKAIYITHEISMNQTGV